MITPPAVKPGDKIGIVSSARKVTPAEMEKGLSELKNWGLVPVPGKHLYDTCNQFAGADANRARDLQEMLDNPEIKAILFARGGYGTLRIIDQLDFKTFLANPKWLAGYSDITVLHSHLNRLGIETIHSHMMTAFNQPETTQALKSLRDALFGNSLHYAFSNNFGTLAKTGECTGELTGGNLSLLYALSGSASEVNTDGKIMFIEDIDEYLYHIDRMMLQLKRAGKLRKLRGLIVGGMTDMKDNAVPFGKTAQEIIYDAINEYDYPVCFGFPAGHVHDNRTLILGRTVHLRIDKENCKLIFHDGRT